MTEPKTIQFLWQYMVYADAQVLSAADTLPDEAYFRDQGISFGSVHKLIVHCLSAHHTWLQRLNGVNNPQHINPAEVLRSQIDGRWAAAHQSLLAFADAQTPASLAQEIESTNRKGERYRMPIGLCMLHVSDHATYHRGQINSMIKLAGGTPSPVMIYTYGISQGIGRQQ
jgi:uncharacterized damage-inducible protein DinB